jgi:hypothetical protein
MITLSSLLTQLQDQFYNVSLTAVPSATRTESIRQALAHLNAAFVETYTIANLDGASSSTLPTSHVSALLLGASAYLLDFTIRLRLVTYPGSTELSDPLYLWAKIIKQDFDLALTRLRLIDLQQSPNPPFFQLPPTSNGYDMSLDG